MTRLRTWIWILFLGVVALGVARLRFDVEILNLLPDSLAVARGLKLYQQHFAAARELVIAVEAPTAEAAETAARELASRLRSRTGLVASVTWQPAWDDHREAGTELVAYLWLNGDPSALEALSRRIGPSNRTEVLESSIRDLATSWSPGGALVRAYDPYGFLAIPGGGGPGVGDGGEVFSADGGRFRLLFVEARPDLGSYRACRAWLGEVRRLVEATVQAGGVPAGVAIGFTGRPVFVTEIADGIEGDTAGSAGGTLMVIGILFWLTHRRWRPLWWLLGLLALILAGTTAVGGLWFGSVNVVSMGFASILLGLAEDFGVVIYQESRSHPGLGEAELRRDVAPGICWSAVTTAGAFLVLNLSSMPGLGQLGTFVAIGIGLAAVLMLYGYLPVITRLGRRAEPHSHAAVGRRPYLLFTPRWLLPPVAIWGITAALGIASVTAIAAWGLRFDRSTNPLKPKQSEAAAVLERLQARLKQDRQPLWLLVSGGDDAAVAGKLAGVDAVLSNAVARGDLTGFTSPRAIWPHPEFQASNRAAAAKILGERADLRTAALEAGFTPDALTGMESVLGHWERALRQDGVFWPTNQASQWILNKAISRSESDRLDLVLIYPGMRADSVRRLGSDPRLTQERGGILLTGWDLLGTTVFDTVIAELPRLVIPILLLVLASLWLAFRSLQEVALSLATLAFSGLWLVALMDLLGWEWNLLNLMAIPLLLGMGVDFSIHVQLALRRHYGNRQEFRQSLGRALLLAGSTTIAGFGSLSFSSNAGMASLGQVCALGILLSLLTAVYLLPVWWIALGKPERKRI